MALEAVRDVAHRSRDDALLDVQEVVREIELWRPLPLLPEAERLLLVRDTDEVRLSLERPAAPDMGGLEAGMQRQVLVRFARGPILGRAVVFGDLPVHVRLHLC